MIAQRRFPDELAMVNTTMVPFRSFFASTSRPTYAVAPDRLIGESTTLSLGGVEFVLHPVAGGETSDGLLVHLPELGVVFVGDVFMPYVGAPFLPEGSVEGLLEAIRRIRGLHPSLLIHGHTPLTDLFTVEALAGLEAALRELRAHVLAAIQGARTLQGLRERHQQLKPFKFIIYSRWAGADLQPVA